MNAPTESACPVPTTPADDLAARISALPEELTEAMSRLLDAAESVADRAGAAPNRALRYVLNQAFQDSVSEFFTDETSSTKLPAPFRDRLQQAPDAISLPFPDDDIDIELVEALRMRRSQRSFSNEQLDLPTLSTLLHHSVRSHETEAGYGVNGMPLYQFGTIGGLCGLRFDIVANRVDGLEQGRYQYDPVGHGLVPVDIGDYRALLGNVTFETDWIFYAPVVLLCIIDQERTSWKYKTRAYRFAHVDLGAATQTLALASTALGLGSCPVAAYFDADANEALNLDGQDEYLGLLFPVGHPPRLGR